MAPAQDWGFYAHRLINRMAVFTLPPEMMMLYKPNIDYLAEHAVDPDKRRYATPFEAVRHYIDLERWGTYPFPDLPRDWTDALMQHTALAWVESQGDTTFLEGWAMDWWRADTCHLVINGGTHPVCSSDFGNVFRKYVMPKYYDDPWRLDCDSVIAHLSLPPDLPCEDIWVMDSLSGHGVLPYHLVQTQRQLTRAFIGKNVPAILRLSADLGHYIGDAHVPLHTTENYNGQLTDQLGIHAFWESRIPELFAEEQYDFFVGKAKYIADPVSYYWDIVLTSHTYVDSVLHIEKRLSQTYPSDAQYCFEERLDLTVRTQCRAYAEAYHQALSGQVERRMRAAIRAIGSAWYTAWVDAGQPDFSYEEATLSTDQLDDPIPALTPGRKMGHQRKHESGR